MAVQVHNAVQLFKRAGLLGGLLGGDDDDDSSATSTAASAAATKNSGLLGGLDDGLSSVGAGLTSGVGEVTSALGGLAPSATTTSSSAAATSSVASTTPSATVASSTSAPLSSATSSAVSSAASSTITAAPSVYVATEGGQAVTITSHITAQAAESTSSAAPAPAGFLQNKGAVAGTFTVVGLVVLVLLFIASTWCIRRNKRNRLLEEAVDWSPQTHLAGGAAADTEKGYPSDLYRTNSGSSNNSRSTSNRYPAPSTYRDHPQPPLPSQNMSQNMYGNGGNAYGGYYDKPVPAAPGSQYAGSQYAPSIAPSQRTQQAYGQTTYGQYPAYNQAPPPPSLQPAQNPFNPNANVALAAPPFDRSHARTPSPTDSDMAYLGYVDAPGNGVRLGRKVSLTKATATTVQHGSAEGAPDGPSALKVVNE
ncbi:unnamed protein product [Peniophora sp. CBMAI 1063]|nr:unnamed protein product [Peniophora sp. CBMAI 1063]